MMPFSVRLSSAAMIVIGEPVFEPAVEHDEHEMKGCIPQALGLPGEDMDVGGGMS